MTADPYRLAGLSGNPFVGEPAEPWNEAGWAERVLPRPLPPGSATLIQFVGVKGAGKSTTLRRWSADAPAPSRYVPPGLGRWRPLPVAPLVYWDEADRAPDALRCLAFRLAARCRATVVAGTHVDLAPEARRVGLAVRTAELPAITVPELTRWAQSRLASAGGTDWTVPAADAACVVASAGASWRKAADLMHIWVAEEVARRTA